MFNLFPIVTATSQVTATSKVILTANKRIIIMYSKIKHAKTLLLLSALSTSAFAEAQDLPFKMVVMSDSISSQDIMQEAPKTSIKKLKSSRNSKYSYNANMGLCVAYLQDQSLNKSLDACSAAINSKELKALNKKQSNYYKALAYNNRGISKYKSGDISGAYSDLALASKTNANPITQANFLLITEVVDASLL